MELDLVVITALHSSKLLKSFEMPMLASMSASVMRLVPSGERYVNSKDNQTSCCVSFDNARLRDM